MLLMQPKVSDDRVTALNSFIKLTQDPANFTAIYDLDGVLRQTHLAIISLEHLQSQPGINEIIRDRYLPPIPDLDALLNYREDSLGYVFASNLRANGFDPVFYRQIEVSDDITYITLRRSQTHDIHHIITGFGTDLAGEIGLQAFELAQMRSPLAIALLTSGIVHTLNSPAALEEMMNAIHRGWQMGLQAKPLMAVRWEEHWEKSVSQWRQELGISI